jgi:hypothetical protein
VVYSTSGGDSLAAGNYFYVFNSQLGDAYGHNVHGFGAEIQNDANAVDIFGDAMPPGYSSGMDYGVPNYEDWVFEDQPGEVLCAGAFGFHGDRSKRSQTEAVAGAHHADDSMVKLGAIDTATWGTSTGTSYRFLDGVQGGEHPTWESGLSGKSAEHNIYKGETILLRNSGTQADGGATVNTMSEFCAGCHGNFHSKGGLSVADSSPWVRHPTDVLIPNAAPFNSYVSYDMSAPVALKIIADNDTSVIETKIGDGNTSIVFCLSCHRAHATSEPDSLRFSYAALQTGDGGSSSTGCFACHSDK